MKIKILLIQSFIILINITFVQSQTLNWAESFGGSEFDAPSSIVIDDFGNVYTIGGFLGTVDFDPGTGITNLTSNGNTDVYIQKLDKDGNFIWAKSLGGTGQDYGYSIKTDNSNNICVVGIFSDTVDFGLGLDVDNVSSNGSLDAFLLKLNADGDLLLKRTFGGTGRDEPNSITIDSNNRIYVAGQFQNTVDFDPGINITNVSAIAEFGTDLFVLKLDENADFLWVKSIGGNGPDPILNPGITGANGITSDPSGNIYLTGFYTRDSDFDPGVGVSELTSTGEYHMFVLKLDDSGNYIWARSLGESADAQGWAIALDNSGNIVTTGYFFDTADFDPGVEVNNLTSNGSYDIYVQKLDSSGNFIWAKSFGSSDQDIGSTILTDSSGNVFVSGHFSETVDFDSSNNIMNIASAGRLDIFILKLDVNGNSEWIESIGGDSIDSSLTIINDNEGNFHLTGRFSNSITFDIGNGNSNLTSNGNFDSFILKFSESTLSNDNNELPTKISFFPNPAKEKLTILSEENFDILLYDLKGVIVRKAKKNTREFSFSLTKLIPGVYFLKGENLKGNFSKKIIITN